MNIIKYRNRKLYNKETSTYVNLQQVATAVASGEELTVTQHATGLDVTLDVLKQVVASPFFTPSRDGLVGLIRTN